MICVALFVSIIGWVLGLGVIQQAKVQANKITEYDFKSRYSQEDAAAPGFDKGLTYFETVFAFETDPWLRGLVTLTEAGNVKAAKYLGFIYANGYRVFQDAAEAEKCLKILDKLSEEVAVWGANIETYDEGDIAYSEGDLLTAFKIWKTLADDGYIRAHFSVGKMRN